MPPPSPLPPFPPFFSFFFPLFLLPFFFFSLLSFLFVERREPAPREDLVGEGPADEQNRGLTQPTPIAYEGPNRMISRNRVPECCLFA